MSFLPNVIDLYEGETIESALLRLCKANHFEYYNDLSIEVKSWLEEHHPTVAGAFPLALGAVNIYHAKQNSKCFLSRRYRLEFYGMKYEAISLSISSVAYVVYFRLFRSS